MGQEQFTPETKTALVDLTEQALAKCTDGGDPIHFRNVFSAMLRVAGTTMKIDHSLLGEQLVYRFLLENRERFQIPFFADRLTALLDFEVGFPHTYALLEYVGFIFFERLPKTLALIQAAKVRPILERLDDCERGWVAGLKVDDSLLVVKATASEQETEIAIHLGERNLAPRIFESTPDEIVEEYIPDPPLDDFLYHPRVVGDKLGWIITKLHQEGIVYDNNFSRHVLVKLQMRELKPPIIRIIDLESAHWGTDFERDWERAYEFIAKTIKKRSDRRKARAEFERWRKMEQR